MKKTEVITFRTDSTIKEKLTQIAQEKKWSVAQVVDEICKEYFKEGENNGNNNK